MAENVPLIDVGRFRDVEASERPESFVRWMEHQRRTGPDVFIDELDIGPGDAVLDVGCGPGVDLAELHTRTRSAVGIDLSASMVVTARKRVNGEAGVAVANGQYLPFSTNAFAGCLCRAVLVHAPDPAAIVDEIARVLEPGGRCVLAEPDHGSHIASTTEIDVFERIKAHRRTQFQNPSIGRSLPHLARQAGLTVESSWAIPIVFRNLADARAAGGPFDVAAAAATNDDKITQREADRYIASLETLDEHGGFFFAGMSIATVAQLDP